MTFEDWKNDNWPQDFADDYYLNEYIMKIAKDARGIPQQKIRL